MEPQAQPAPGAPLQTPPQPTPVSAPAVHYSGLIKRIVAVVADQFLIMLVLFIVYAIFYFSGVASEIVKSFNGEAIQVIVAIVYIVYCTLLEARNGQTLGKKMVGIKVIRDNGQPCDFKSSLIRNLCKIIDGILGIFVLLIIAVTPKKQRIGDMVAKTVVVEARPF